jgi:hypothetical protein
LSAVSRVEDTKEKLLNKETLIKVLIQGTGLMLAGLTAFKLGLLYLQWSGSSKNF